MANGKWQMANGKGFTLVEMLVSVGLFTTLAVIIISVLFTAFRANKKSEIILAVKQNGNTALSRIEQGIKFAKSLDDPVSCVPDVTQTFVTVTAFDGGQTRYGCPGVDTESISSNSAALVDVNSVSVDPDTCSFTCSQISTNDPPTITIKFTLSAANATDFAETSSVVPFQTVVTMRNYNR